MRPLKVLLKGLGWVTPRRIATCAAASGGIVVAQGVYLLHAYVPMPPPRGDTFGLESWQDAGAVHQPKQSAGSTPARRQGDSNEAGSPVRAASRRRNVLIIGDSLVVGIGCKDTMVLPQRICRQISDLLQVDISWRAVGVNGGDVRTIHQEVLDSVKRFQNERETRYREYIASLEAASDAQCQEGANSPALLSGSATAPLVNLPSVQESTAAMSVLASSNAEKSQQLQQLLRHHLHQNPPHLRGAGEALFDFVRTHYYLKLAERGVGLGTWGAHAQGDTVFSAGSHEASALISEPSPRVDAVIVLCGLNDLKSILRGRTSTHFRADLSKLVTDLRAEVGDCIVILPAMPMECAHLPEPLRSAAIQVCAYYDLQKQKIATSSPLIHFIPKPAIELWNRAKERYGEIVAQDGVHPNEVGYKVFADFLAQEVAELLTKGDLKRLMSTPAISSSQRVCEVEAVPCHDASQRNEAVAGLPAYHAASLSSGRSTD